MRNPSSCILSCACLLARRRSASISIFAPHKPAACAHGYRAWVRSWIVLWDGDNPTEAACAEAEAVSAGRFNGLCTAKFTRIVNGFAVTVCRGPSPPPPLVLGARASLAASGGSTYI